VTKIQRKEKFLLELLDEAKRLVVALNVAKERGLRGQDLCDRLYRELAASLLTALMVTIGYRIPDDMYSLPDYGKLCDWLGAREEDGRQRWEDE
jgi:hypothetical protein